MKITIASSSGGTVRVHQVHAGANIADARGHVELLESHPLEPGGELELEVTGASTVLELLEDPQTNSEDDAA